MLEAHQSWAGQPGWYVVQCKPQSDARTASILKETLGLPAYIPEVNRRYHGKVRPAPLFPGYFFVQLDLREVRLSGINSTPGVIRLLDFDGVPQTVPDEVIHTLRERVGALNAQGGVPLYNFRPGDSVRIKEGALRGLEAVFVGPLTPSARVKVLLHFLGRLNEVKVDLDSLEPASPNHQRVPAGGAGRPDALRQRGTRGKGRRIKASARF